MFFAMMILLFVVMRFAVGGPRGRCMPMHHHRHWQLQQARVRPRVQPAQPEPNAFERLKQRYVRGDLTDAQYESEVDALLRAPETRKLVP